jgi:hypothetical protein
MTKTRNSTSNRRSFLLKAATVAAGSAALAMAPTYPAPAMTLQAVPDPILEAIEGHRAAYAAFSAAVRRNTALDGEFIGRQRRARTRAAKEAIVRTDDPRWIESKKERDQTSEAEEAAAVRLIDVRPTTLPGMIALLEYVLVCECSEYGGGAWPDGLVDDNDEERSWYHFLLENLAAALTLGVA